MAKQLFLCPVIGTGGPPSPDGTPNHYRPLLEDTARTVNAARPGANATPPSPAVAAVKGWIPVDPVNGQPLRSWCLCIVAATDLRPFQNVVGVHPLPDFPKDGKVSAVQRAKLLGLIGAMNARGIDTGFLLNADGSVKADGWREVIRGIGRAAGDTAFHEDNFDRPDIS